MRNSVEPIQHETRLSKVQNRRLQWALIGFALTFGYLFILYAVNPGYIIPLFNNPISRIVMLFAFVWQLVGSLLLIFIPFSEKLMNSPISKYLYFWVFVMPAVLGITFLPLVQVVPNQHMDLGPVLKELRSF
ncbi:MAG: hypothetical protein IPG59_06835 [Candidatus Melainabacteria bacterium]|nr:MAG: hypothetical protein IPG59_06835 [Candidatus Melainabacteria bacterium]